MSKVWRHIDGRRAAPRCSRWVGYCLVLACALAAVAPAVAQQGDVAQHRITLAFQDAAAADAIAQFRWVAEVPIVFSPPPETRMSLSMMDVPLNAALDALCRQIGYEWRTVGEVYVLYPAQRTPLLPAPAELEDRVLYPDRQHLDAARLVLALTEDQVASLSGGASLRYSVLSPSQQDLLKTIYGRLLAAARGRWIEGAQGLASGPDTPPDSLAFGIRGFVWRLQQPTPGPATAPSQPRPQQPAPPSARTVPPGVVDQPVPGAAPVE